MELGKLSGFQLYMMRNSENAEEIDAELDRRNQKAAKVASKPRRNSSKMVDYQRENNRWYIQDDGTVTRVEA